MITSPVARSSSTRSRPVVTVTRRDRDRRELVQPGRRPPRPAGGTPCRSRRSRRPVPGSSRPRRCRRRPDMPSRIRPHGLGRPVRVHLAPVRHVPVAVPPARRAAHPAHARVAPARPRGPRRADVSRRAAASPHPRKMSVSHTVGDVAVAVVVARAAEQSAGALHARRQPVGSAEQTWSHTPQFSASSPPTLPRSRCRPSRRHRPSRASHSPGSHTPLTHSPSAGGRKQNRSVSSSVSPSQSSSTSLHESTAEGWRRASAASQSPSRGRARPGNRLGTTTGSPEPRRPSRPRRRPRTIGHVADRLGPPVAVVVPPSSSSGAPG